LNRDLFFSAFAGWQPLLSEEQWGLHANFPSSTSHNLSKTKDLTFVDDKQRQTTAKLLKLY
jgi:hypothetical protein